MTPTPALLRSLLAVRFAADPPRCVDERELQVALGAHLRAVCAQPDYTGPTVIAEHRLPPLSRLDFYVRELAEPAGLAIEVKIDGAPMAVLRQLFRYAEHPAVSGVLLVTTRSKHRGIVPGEILGKPAACLFLGDYLL